MRSKIPSTRLLIVLGAAVVACSSVAIFFLNSAAPGRISRTGSSSLIDGRLAQNAETTAPGLPMRLTIPEIGVNAAIEYVGITPQGDMGVPSDPASAAWFDPGPRPGENGSAVIAGHEGWKDGIAAVFDDLYKLKVGDEIYVEDKSGATAAFVVRGLRTYDPNEDASTVFDSNDGKAHLSLITCAGTWNTAQKSYSNRLVVFADKE